VVKARKAFSPSGPVAENGESHHDMSDVLDLLGRVAGLHQSLIERRYALFDGLCKLVRADIWVWVYLHIPGQGLPVNSNAIDGGWIDESERSRMYAAVNTPDCHALSTLLAGQARAAHRPLTVIAEQISEPADVALAHDRFLKSVNLSSRMISIYPRSDSTYGLFTLSRRKGSPLFSPQDAQFVHRLLAHVTWVHQLDSEMSRHADPLLSLTRRERQILRMSMVGHGRKQIAELLDVTLNTVTDHFKSIYRKLGVRSQGELLSKFISGKLE
jgi:DNA-binding CsgD family transcriptional regulator